MKQNFFLVLAVGLLLVCLAVPAQATTVTVDFNTATDVDDFLTLRDDAPDGADLAIAQNAAKGAGATASGGLEAINVGTLNTQNDLAVLYAPGGVAGNGAISLSAGETLTMSMKFKVWHNDEAATPRLGIASFSDAAAATTNWSVLDINQGKDMIGHNAYADGIAVNVATGGDKTFNIVNAINGTGRTLIPDPSGPYTLVDGAWYQYILEITKLATVGDFDVAVTLNALNADGTALVSQVGSLSQAITNAGLYADGDVIAGLTIVHDGEPDTVSNEYDDLVIDAPVWGLANTHTPAPTDEDTNLLLDTTLAWESATAYAPTKEVLYIRPAVQETAGFEPNWLDTANTYMLDSAVSPVDPDSDTILLTPDFRNNDAWDYSTKYYWRVDSYEPNAVPILHTGATWSFTTIAEEPSISKQPLYATVLAGETTVDLTIEGTVTDVYTWYKADDPSWGPVVDGVEGTPLASSTLTVSEEGYYYCVVSNGVSAVTVQSNTVGAMTTRRLVGHWDFEGTLNSSVGGFTGTYADPNEDIMPTEVYTDIADPNNLDGQALFFNDDNNTLGYHVRVDGDPNDFNFYTAGYTVSAWVKMTEGGYGAAVSKQNMDKNQGFILNHFGGTATHTLRNRSVNDNTVSINNGQWRLMTGTYDPNDGAVKLYVDGVLKNQGTRNGPQISDEPLIFGCGLPRVLAGVPVSPYTGYLDEVRIWNYPRTAEAIAWDYNDFRLAGTSAPCIDGAGLLYDVAGGPLDGEGNPTPDCYIGLADFVEIIANNWLNCRLASEDCITDPRP